MQVEISTSNGSGDVNHGLKPWLEVTKTGNAGILLFVVEELEVVWCHHVFSVITTHRFSSVFRDTTILFSALLEGSSTWFQSSNLKLGSVSAA